jgi:peptidoglycan/xylan/chitin deacetylase (PgdA/CDA1 family)
MCPISGVNKTNNGFLSLCYHYIRPSKDHDKFPRLLGLEINEFKKQIEMLKENFQMVSLGDVLHFSQKESNFSKTGMLITFDDGLSDHYLAAEILFKLGIKGVFFIPTCIFENEPANPVIIHYCLAQYGIKNFLKEYEIIRKNLGISHDFILTFDEHKDDPWTTIDKIKSLFKYKLTNTISRQILLEIYESTMKKDFPNALELMHLSKEQVKKIVEMGHDIGVHTHTHISVAPSKLTPDEFKNEIVKPKQILEHNFFTNIFSVSYPFGETQDCLSSIDLLSKTELFKLAFTVEPILNSHKTNPLEFGRYQPHSTDKTNELKQFLETIEEEKL